MISVDADAVPGDGDGSAGTNGDGASTIETKGPGHEIPLRLKGCARVVEACIEHGHTVFAGVGIQGAEGASGGGPVPDDVEAAIRGGGDLCAANAAGGDGAGRGADGNGWRPGGGVGGLGVEEFAGERITREVDELEGPARPKDDLGLDAAERSADRDDPGLGGREADQRRGKKGGAAAAGERHRGSVHGQ